MIRLQHLAFGALVITSTAAHAQDGKTIPETSPGTIAMISDIKASGGLGEADSPILLGQHKAAPLCPDFCAPRPITSPAQATVGERDVLAATLAAAAGSKLHVDSHRSAFATIDKLPSVAPASQAPITMTTRSEFRPALDPVLAEPTINPTE